MQMIRFPHTVYGVGAEPDPRFSLANERTFLAWCRTSLAVISLAVALDNITIAMNGVVRVIITAMLLLMGCILPVLAWRDWAACEKAMRLGKPLPGSVAQLVFAAGTIICTALSVVGVISAWMGA